MKVTLSIAEYKALSNLYNEFNIAFRCLPNEIKLAYYAILYEKR